MANVQTFSNISLATASRKNGRINLTKKGAEWVSIATHEGEPRRRLVVKSSTLQRAEWCRFGSTCQLKLVTSSGKPASEGDESKTPPTKIYRFDGFVPRDFEKVRQVVQDTWNSMLDSAAVASKGGNWGEFKFADNHMKFVSDDGKLVLEIPNDEISQCALPTKNEVELQFLEDDTAAKDDELLVEMRVFVPPSYGGTKEEEQTAAEGFQKLVRETAGIIESSADAICSFSQPDPLFLTPRGRYEVELFSQFFRLKGKTYDFKIQYKHVSRFYLLPRPNGAHVAFVISLDDPIRQGKQRYQHLVIQLDRLDERELELAIPEGDTVDPRFKGLQPRMRGPIHRLMAKTLKHLTQRKVYTPAKIFESRKKTKAVKCALKSNDGLLFPLDNSFFFIHKPATHVRFSDIEAVEFLRYSAAGSTAQRTFDLRIALKESASAGSEVVFNSIDRAEYESLVRFLRAKNIVIMNLQQKQQNNLYESSGDEGGLGDESEEDSDFEAAAEDSDEDEADEQALKELVPEAPVSKSKKRARDESGDDDDDEDEDGGDDGGDDDGDDGSDASAAPSPAKKQRGSTSDDDLDV